MTGLLILLVYIAIFAGSFFVIKTLVHKTRRFHRRRSPS